MECHGGALMYSIYTQYVKFSFAAEAKMALMEFRNIAATRITNLILVLSVPISWRWPSVEYFSVF
jgi:hypothetical protein